MLTPFKPSRMTSCGESRSALIMSNHSPALAKLLLRAGRQHSIVITAAAVVQHQAHPDPEPRNER